MVIINSCIKRYLYYCSVECFTGRNAYSLATLQTLARCCSDNNVSLCNVYKFTINNCIALSKYCVKELFWKEFVHSHIL